MLSAPATATDKRKSDEDGEHLHITTIDDADEPSALPADLQTISVTHVLSKAIPARYRNTFEGMMIDAGAACGSVSGKTQYTASCPAAGRAPAIDETHATLCHSGIGSTEGLGVATI